MAEISKTSNFHVVMFPWLAVGHMTPFLQLANKLAERGCSTSLLLTDKAIQQLNHFNHHPCLIKFHSLVLPHVEDLPVGTQTASDIPIHLTHFLSIAMDRTRDQLEQVIRETKPKFIFYDMAHWVPQIAKPLGIKTINFVVVCAASIAIVTVPARNICKDMAIAEEELSEPPTGYPSSVVVLRRHEARLLTFVFQPFGEGITFYERICTGLRECDAIAIRTCRETEGKMCDYIESQYKKPVFLTGPLLDEPVNAPLEDRWVKWLSRYEPGSVVFCSFGSQCILEKSQFQELVLGLELSGFPFLVALKKPMGVSTIEEALPEGFEERVRGRGVVCGEWVQQVMFLDHPSVGCFVSHCGFGSMWESLMSNCQIVLVPQLGDQILNTRLLAEEIKVAMEVERDENGWFQKENLSKAIKTVMDKDGELGATVMKNHAKWRETLKNQRFMSNYVDKFIQNMRLIVRSSEATI
ncbi:hypothetical protein K2173_026908 [Erythroxylum novogranatense]|uniref:Glycosyltransferase n=1 Tax=Erythroxylum novogranatense TaxID=1862640 RepID=A0AAV8TXI4_9ROSI|nr:hypothetical protein K2173_026908 [Erythroxylum novogranatense]